jgi:hypothetical protein
MIFEFAASTYTPLAFGAFFKSDVKVDIAQNTKKHFRSNTTFHLYKHVFRL